MQRAKQHSRKMAPAQAWPEKFRRTPVPHARTTRSDEVSVVTSSLGGKLVPLKAIPLLRNDAVSTSRVSVNVQMSETASMLLNPVRITVAAHIVPKLAFERFQDMATIDRSYNGIPEKDGAVVPWFQEIAFNSGDANEIFTALGLHASLSRNPNTDYLEAYNAIWNYEATRRSNKLTLRSATDTTLAPAFWRHTQMQHVKPSFDDALIDGEIELTMTGDGLPVSGIGIWGPSENFLIDATSIRTVEGASVPAVWQPNAGTDYSEKFAKVAEDPNNPGFPGVFAELGDQGLTVSLANIELAKKTQAWAKLRNQYQGVSEDWMIDQLLQGIPLRDEVLRQPILVDSRDTIVGMSQRYATDGANLDKSVTDGRTMVDLTLRTPTLPCGGVLMITAQALPEMVYERQRDHYFMAGTVEELPNRTRDELDPQPVELWKNADIDEAHGSPDDLFGYAPLNAKWVRRAPNVGGKYYRKNPADPWNEDRNRIWSTEVVDPVLGPDFYLSTTLSHQVFADQNSDPFEWWVGGDVSVSGLTYFGPTLAEGNGDYDAVNSQVDKSRLKGDGTDVPEADAAS